MIRGILTLLVVFGLAYPGFAAEEEQPEELLERVKNSIVVISQAGRDGGWQGLGAGFVISEEGLVATSLHVIGEGRPVTVTFADGKSYTPVEVRAWDRKSDLALLKIAGTNLPALRLGDSDNLKQGRRVYAMGNPQGLKFSAVQGIVSAVREFEMGPMIQIAIPIEPGNSGGPLIDERGRVQGVISMKSVVTENLGFAVPINRLKSMMEKPNPVAMEKWLTLGTLPKSQWEAVMGASWRRKSGLIRVEGEGSGFGGRSLCISAATVPEVPYEVSVRVKLDDEGGAAGLAFAIDKEHRHYGFYPTAGKMRLTRFDGPTVYSWEILQDKYSAAYELGEWNELRVRVEEKSLTCFVNGEETFKEELEHTPVGQAGLAKFRDTAATFKGFQLTAGETRKETKADELVQDFRPTDELPMRFLKDPSSARAALLAKASETERLAQGYRKSAEAVHARAVVEEMRELFSRPEEEIRLFEAGMLVAQLDDPELEGDSYRAELKAQAEAVKQAARNSTNAQEQVTALNKVFFEENGFHGSRFDYYSYENSYVTAALDDREGIPLTLSILYLEIGERAGLTNLYGLAFPGHFMVGLRSAEARYVDVFDGGKIYGDDQIYRVVNERSEVPLQEKHFVPATKREMIVRMLRNLVALASDKRDPARVRRYLDLLLAISPEEAPDRFRRAFISIQSGERESAREDLEYLIKQKPPELNVERIKELLDRLD